MKRQRAILALVVGILACFAMLAFSGCAVLKKKPSAVHAGAMAADGIAESLSALEKVNETLYDSRPRLVDYYETVAISEAVQKATIANDAFVDRVKALKQANVSDPAQVAAYFADLSAALDGLNQKGVLGVKNADARARLSAAFQLVKAAADAVAIQLQIAKPAVSLDIPPDDKANVAATGIEAASTPEFQGFDAGVCGGACGVFLNWKYEAGSAIVQPGELKGETILSTPPPSDDAPSGPRALLRAGLSEDDLQTDLPEPESPAPLLALDALALSQLLGLALQLFGVGSKVVETIRAESGMSDDELLAAAEKSDQATRDAIAAHLEAVKAQSPAEPAIAPTEGD